MVFYKLERELGAQALRREIGCTGTVLRNSPVRSRTAAGKIYIKVKKSEKFYAIIEW